MISGKLTPNYIVFILFIGIVFYLLTNHIENFTSKRKKEMTKRQRRKERAKKKAQQKKENFLSLNWLKSNTDKGQKEREKFKNDMNLREVERHNIIRNKSSKDTTDSYKKFNSLKQGLYDILKFGNIGTRQI